MQITLSRPELRDAADQIAARYPEEDPEVLRWAIRDYLEAETKALLTDLDYRHRRDGDFALSLQHAREVMGANL